MGSAREVRGPPRGDVGRLVKHGLLAAGENRVPLRERFDNKNENHGGKNAGDRGIEALVEDEALRFGDFLGRDFSRRDLRTQYLGVGQKA